MLPSEPAPPVAYTAHPRHRTDIDGLRVFAIFAVVLFHGALIPGGYIGVDVFFVISGFLMASIIQQSLDEGKFTFLEFYARRARRIFPAFVVVLALAGILGCFLMLPADVKNLGRSLIVAAQFRSNFYFYDGATGYFTADAIQFEPLLHTWSLSVEMQFYLIFPVLLWGVSKYARRFVPHALGFVAVSSLCLAQYKLSGNPQYAFYMLAPRMWELLAGAMMFYLPALRRGRMAVFVLALFLLFAPAFLYTDQTSFPALAAIPPVLGACLILLARPGSVPEDGVLCQIFGNRVTAWLANISYSFYLWHWPLFVYARYNDGEVLSWRGAVLLLAVSLTLAALTYRYVERPFLMRRALPKRTLYVQGAMLLCLALAGAALRHAASPVIERILPEKVMLLYQGREDMLREDCQPYRDKASAKPGRIGVGEACHLGDPDAPPRFILWGDSFARMWLPAMREQGMTRHIAGMQSVRSACSPADSINDRRREECKQFNRDTMDYILEHKELKTVVLAANWRRPMEMEADIMDIVRTLTADKRTVYIMLSPPRPGYQVPRALAISELRGFPRPDLESAASYKEQSDTFAALLKEAQDQYGLRVIRLDSALCPEEACLVEADGRALYSDAFHLTQYAVLKYSWALDGLFQYLEGQKP